MQKINQMKLKPDLETRKQNGHILQLCVATGQLISVINVTTQLMMTHLKQQ